MDSTPITSESTAIASGRWLLGLALVCSALCGCAAFHPIRGVPAPYLPPEYLGPSRSGKKTIDLSLLVQTQPDQYRVAGGDTLSIYIPGVLGSLNIAEDKQIGETPPINLSTNPAEPPTIGYPITVRDDGTIALPYVDPIAVHGMTLPQIELAIRDAYTQQSQILNAERDRVLVSLQRRREVSVIVVRQETSSELTLGAQPGTLNVGNSKRGTARTVRLPAYENDVLHALANSQQGSDGLPGLDAKNTIYIIRRKRQQFEPNRNVTIPAVPHVPRPVFAPHSSSPARALSPEEDNSNVLPAPPRHTGPRNDKTEVPRAHRVDPAPQLPSVEQPPQTRVPQRIELLPQAAPPLTPKPSPPQPSSPPEPATPASEAGRAPAWPAPAQPDQSIQRTSGLRTPHAAPIVWPQVRGQSPAEWPWGHTSSSSDDTGGPIVPPADHVPQPFGHGSFPEAIVPQPAPGLASDATEIPYGTNEGPQLWPRMQPSMYGHDSLCPPHDSSFAGGHDGTWRGLLTDFDPTVDNPNVIKIPIRLAEGERPTFTERDIILEDGDIVFIESRETEVFYTGGLLGGGQYTLPRDYDLRVLEAISIAQSPQNTTQGTGRAIGGVSSLNHDVTISASHVVILRTLPNGTRIPIEVDLYKAVRRPQEDLLIQPGDLVILQYTKIEAIAAFLERHLLEGALFGLAAAQVSTDGN